MNDVAVRWLAAGTGRVAPDLGALWIAAEPIRGGEADKAAVGEFELTRADAAQLPPCTRFAGAGFRADPSTEGSADALTRAARDALARARRAPEEIDAIVLTPGCPEVLTAIFGAEAAARAESSRPLRDAIAAIESGRARRVLVLEEQHGAIAQAAVLEPTNDGSPTFMHASQDRALRATNVLLPSASTPQLALRAIGQEAPLPAALTIGLVAANTNPTNAAHWIRSLGLRGTALSFDRSVGLDDLVALAQRLIASGSGTAFLVTDGQRFGLVTSTGFRDATKP